MLNHRLSVTQAAALLLLVASAMAVVMAAPEKPQQQVTKCSQQQSADRDADVFFQTCPQGQDWVKYGSNCYRYFNIDEPKYWLVAEANCIKYGGHLTSIANERENRFVAKLTYCRDAWIGRYAVNVDYLHKRENYRYTDGTNELYHKHNFSSITSIHQPLISARDTMWNNNVYHARHHYVCKVVDRPGNYTCDCPTGWKQLDGYCYLMPHFNATYIEADFFCRGKNAHVTSLHSKRELRAMSLMDVEIDGCPFETWTGLVKLNPCRPDYFSGLSTCFTWSDRTGNYTGFPSWHSGSPILDERTNCALLQEEGIRSAPCHTRARFVCKKPVGVPDD